MASTFTLNIQNRSTNRVVPRYVTAKVYPVATYPGPPVVLLPYIKDTVGDIVLNGHTEKYVKTAEGGATELVQVEDLPDPRDTTYNPSDFGFKAHVKDGYRDLTVYFGAAELDLYESGGVIELEDILTAPAVAFDATATYANASALSAEALSRSQADDALTTALGTKANASALGAETTRATNAETALRTGTDTTFETRLSNAFAPLSSAFTVVDNDGLVSLTGLTVSDNNGLVSIGA